ncbi:MAG: hypothetical protein PHF29_07515 [Candidatus Riflebacteria bacterium]|nr:hypothetical protein [Candidatus Riflebacteria bacterium]
MKKVTFTKISGDILSGSLVNNKNDGFDIFAKTDTDTAVYKNKRNYKKYVVFSSSLSNNINYLNNVSIKFTYVDPTI